MIHRLCRWMAVGLIVSGVLLPLAPQVLWSFADRWFFPALWPQAWGGRAWRYVLSPSSQVGEAVGNSLWLALTVVLLAVVIGLPAARVLGLHHFRGKPVVHWLIGAPLFVPPLVVMMGIHLLFIRYQLADSFLGVVLVHLLPALPYFVLVMASVFATYATELEETARTLGADPLRAFWYITLPTIFPGLLIAMLFTFLVSWSQYITTVLIGGGRVVTLPMVLLPLISAADHANAAAVSLVFIFPALLILFLTTRAVADPQTTLGGFGR
ncbi:MAG: ABC transporter permease subunit [Caldilineaceae bacterium]|nr:ABC transporter permease subunit [Caldilineaceae bacterium]